MLVMMLGTFYKTVMTASWQLIAKKYKKETAMMLSVGFGSIKTASNKPGDRSTYEEAGHLEKTQKTTA